MAPKPSASQFLLGSVGVAVLLSRLCPGSIFSHYIASSFSLFLITQVLSIFYSAIIWPRFLSPLRHLPHPKNESLLFGQFLKIHRASNGQPMREWAETIPNDGLIYYTTILGAERVLVLSPKALMEVLTTKSYDFVKPSNVSQGIRRILGNGLLVAEGDEHKGQRRQLLPAFAFRHIKDLHPMFWSKARESVHAMSAVLTASSQRVSNGVDEKGVPYASDVLEIDSWASRVTLDIIGIAGAGQDFGAIRDPSSRLNQLYRDIFKASRRRRVFQVLQMILPGPVLRCLPFKSHTLIDRSVGELRQVYRDLIVSKRAKLEKRDANDFDILSVALESGGFTDEELVDQLLTFLAAGHETTASSMSWAIYYLCRYPDMQTRLRDEIRASLPSISDLETEITSAAIDKMSYLHAFCNETNRVLPPVAITFRTAARPQTLLGQPIPVGTTVVLAPWATNVSPELWGPDSHEFNPERWMKPGQANNGGSNSNYAFMTFLHGPRSCIGMGFAKAEFACILAAWVGSFEFSFRDGAAEVEILGGITARPKGGLHVHVKPLEGW